MQNLDNFNAMKKEKFELHLMTERTKSENAIKKKTYLEDNEK